MSARIFNVLFLCTGNTARSILAEGTLNHLPTGKVPLDKLDHLALQRQVHDIGTR